MRKGRTCTHMHTHTHCACRECTQLNRYHVRWFIWYLLVSESRPCILCSSSSQRRRSILSGQFFTQPNSTLSSILRFCSSRSCPVKHCSLICSTLRLNLFPVCNSARLLPHLPCRSFSTFTMCFPVSRSPAVSLTLPPHLSHLHPPLPPLSFLQ